MAEKGLTQKDLEQVFKGFEKRHDEKMKIPEKRMVDQFHIMSEGLIDQIELLAEGHAGIINRLNRVDERLDRRKRTTTLGKPRVYPPSQKTTGSARG
jgi:hypothetical protein